MSVSSEGFTRVAIGARDEWACTECGALIAEGPLPQGTGTSRNFDGFDLHREWHAQLKKRLGDA